MRRLQTLLLGLVALVLSGCLAPPSVRTPEVHGTLDPVLDRTEAYLDENPVLVWPDGGARALSEAEHDQVTGAVLELLDLREQPEVLVRVLRPPLLEVVAYHQRAVGQDPVLTDLERRTYLRSGEVLERLVAP